MNTIKTLIYNRIRMHTIGYEQPDGSVDYVLLYDDTFENIITSVIYQNKPIHHLSGETLNKADNKQDYFSVVLKDEEDTRFRFLKQKDGVWTIRDFYGKIYHDITVSTVMTGGKRRQTRRMRRA